MIPPREAFIHDAELEIIVPNSILECNEENIDEIIDAKQRTQIFYDELLHFYLMITLPSGSNIENKEAAIEFFKNLEITLEATLTDTNLTVHRVPSSNSIMSSTGGMFSNGYGTSVRSRSSSTSTSPTVPGSPASCYSVRKFSVGKFNEGTVIYSAQYNSKNNSKIVIVEKDGCWVCVLPLSFPVAYIRTRTQGQVTLNIGVSQPQRKMMRPHDLDLYPTGDFGLNLLEGLNDDPEFESLNTLCSVPVPTSRLTKQDPTKRTITNSTYKILSVKPTINVRIKITNVSPSESTLIMSVELENDTENDIVFSIEAVKIEIAHAFVTRYGWSQDISNDEFPILLQPFDQTTLLYSITILEDSSFPKPSSAQHHYTTSIPYSNTSRRDSVASINSINALPIENRYRNLSIIVSACPVIDGVRSCCIESRRNCSLDTSTLLTDATIAARNSFNLNNIKKYNSLHNIGCVTSAGPGTNTFNKNDMNLLNVNGGDNGILPSGRLPKLQKQINSNVCEGVDVSFVVCDKPVVGRVFTIKVFIVNRSKCVRRFTIMIPIKKRLDERLFQQQSSPIISLSQTTDTTLVESISLNQTADTTSVESNNTEKFIQPLRDPFMNETEFLRKHLEFETFDADLICLDDNVKIRSIDPYKSESAILHFVSTKESLQTVESVQLVDNDTGFVTNLRNVVQVDVNPCNERSGKRISHNSIALRHIEVTG